MALHRHEKMETNSLESLKYAYPERIFSETIYSNVTLNGGKFSPSHCHFALVNSNFHVKNDSDKPQGLRLHHKRDSLDTMIDR